MTARRFSIEVSEVPADQAGRLLSQGIIDTVVRCKATGNYLVQATTSSLTAAGVALYQIAAGPELAEPQVLTYLRTQAERASHPVLSLVERREDLSEGQFEAHLEGTGCDGQHPGPCPDRQG